MNGAALINPPLLTKPIGAYSQVVRVPVGDSSHLVFVSGQVPADQAGDTVGVGDPAAQAEAVFRNLTLALDAAGARIDDLVAVTIFVTDIAHFRAISQVRNRVFATHQPASTLVQVARLAIADHLVEINGIALLRVSEVAETRGMGDDAERA